MAERPDLDSLAGALWLFLVGSEANRAIRAGDLAGAETSYRTIAEMLEQSTGPRIVIVALPSSITTLVQLRRTGAIWRVPRRGTASLWRSGRRWATGRAWHATTSSAAWRRTGAIWRVPRRGTRKSLEILEALGDRPGMAMSYGQLGLLVEAQSDFTAALDWIIRCIALFTSSHTRRPAPDRAIWRA